MMPLYNILLNWTKVDSMNAYNLLEDLLLTTRGGGLLVQKASKEEGHQQIGLSIGLKLLP